LKALGFWKPFPYDRFEYRSHLPPDEVLRRLGEATAPRQWVRFFWSRPTKPLEGKVSGSTFDCQRVITYRNSFLPRLQGTVEHHPLGGSRISGTMTLLPFVAAFLVVWIGGVSLIGIALLVAFVKEPKLGPLALLPCGMLVFLWVLATLAFSLEARKARALLERLLEAQPPAAGEIGFS
jgi:hypothetical protein